MWLLPRPEEEWNITVLEMQAGKRPVCQLWRLSAVQGKGGAELNKVYFGQHGAQGVLAPGCLLQSLTTPAAGAGRG